MNIGDRVEFKSLASGKVLRGEVVYEDRANVAGKHRQLLEVKINGACGETDRLTYADKCRRIK